MNNAAKKNTLPFMYTSRKGSRPGLNDLAGEDWNSQTQRKKKIQDHSSMQNVDLNGYMRLLRHLQPLEGLLSRDSNINHMLSSKPPTNRFLARQISNSNEDQCEEHTKKGPFANKKHSATLVTRYIHQLKVLQNLQISVASRLRRRILLLIDSYPGMAEKLLSEVSGLLHKRYQLRTQPNDIAERLHDDDLDSFEKIIDRTDEFLKDVRLEELKELGWRITTLQRSFAESRNNSDQRIWRNEETARTIIQLSNLKADSRIKKYRQRQDHLRETNAKVGLLSRSLRKKQEYFVQLNSIEEALAHANY